MKSVLYYVGFGLLDWWFFAVNWDGLGGLLLVFLLGFLLYELREATHWKWLE